MKRIIAIILFAITVFATFIIRQAIPKETLMTVYFSDFSVEEIGVPTIETYLQDKINARNPWDMTILNNNLYIGAGDYGINTGPTDIWKYDIVRDNWSISGTVNEEAVARFIKHNDCIYIPGTDPLDRWELGNYYTYENEQWVKHRTVPYGVHMFDIVQYQNAFFYGIGTSENSQSPVQMTTDNKSFTNIPFYINNKAILGDENYSFSRCYSLFPCEKGLFAFCWWNDGKLYGFFEYRQGAFHYINDIKGLRLDYKRTNRQRLMNETLTLNGKAYFSTGKLYCTNDFITAEQIATPEGYYVQDIYIENDKLYVLTSFDITKSDATNYKNTIWELGENNTLKEVYSFNYELCGMSLAKQNNIFFVGIGKTTNAAQSSESKNGMIIKVTKVR